MAKVKEVLVKREVNGQVWYDILPVKDTELEVRNDIRSHSFPETKDRSHPTINGWTDT